MKTLKRAPGSANQGLVLQEGRGFYLGLDLGQSVDYSALCILEKVYDFEDRRTPVKHHIRYVKRWPLGTRYTDVTEDVVTNFVENEDLWIEDEARPGPLGFESRERPMLVIDATGVGAAVRDELIKTHGASLSRTDLKPVVITGGLSETSSGGRYGVPKSRLLEQMQVDAQFGQLRIVSGMDLLDTLKDELANIRPKIRGDQKYLSYEEIRESVHDDMVLAAALAH